jgi:hypothetical protein
MFEVDYVAVLVAGVAAYLFGWLWYSKMFFGSLWMKLSGKDMGDGKPGVKMILLGVLVPLVTAYVLTYVLDAFGAADVSTALQGAFWVWLGFFATTAFNGYLYGGLKFQLYILDIAHYLAALLIMAAILVSF